MASNAFQSAISLLAMMAVLLTAHFEAQGADIPTNFIAPQGLNINSSFFTFKGCRPIFYGVQLGRSFKAAKVTQVEFPALEGQSVSYAVLQYPSGTLNPPHVHRHVTELLLVVQGWLEVGIVDSANNKLFTQTLVAGDVFVFPQGMVQFEVNGDKKYPALAVAAFGSTNPGVVSLPSALFASWIKEEVLAQSFKIDVAIVEKLISANTG